MLDSLFGLHRPNRWARTFQRLRGNFLHAMAGDGASPQWWSLFDMASPVVYCVPSVAVVHPADVGVHRVSRAQTVNGEMTNRGSFRIGRAGLVEIWLYPNENKIGENGDPGTGYARKSQ